MMGSRRHPGNLVPPKFTSGGYYPLLNSISVRSSVCNPKWGQNKVWVLGAPQSAALVPSYTIKMVTIRGLFDRVRPFVCPFVQLFVTQNPLPNPLANPLANRSNRL